MKKIFLFVTIQLFFASAFAQADVPADYLNFIETIKFDLTQKGISKKLVDEVYKNNFYKPIPDVVKLDRKQNEFVLSTSAYLARALSQKRIDRARVEYKAQKDLLEKINKKYHIPPEVIIAFWAIETNFGDHQGSFLLVESLTQLSYDKRRRDFFKEQLYYLFKIMEDNKIDYKTLKGSWAGAMGHFQFMPYTWYKYGQGNIIANFDDAAFSAANYLHSIGWQENQPWGERTILPDNFDYSLTGRDKTKTLKEWKKFGIKTSLDSTLRASVIAPEGKKGKTYIILNNFRRIMIWNNSQNYALAISLLSEYIKNDQPLEAFIVEKQLKTEDVIKLQTYINDNKIDELEVDGTIGPKTMEAIKKLQKKLGLTPDGWPSEELLKKIP